MQEATQARVLAVASRKGGVGKTTTAVNLAHGLSRKLIRRVRAADLEHISDPSQLYHYQNRDYYVAGHVLLIDLDAQGHCSVALGLERSRSDVGEVLLGRQQLNQSVISADRAEDGLPRPNLWLLPAADSLDNAIESLRSQSLAYVISGYEDKEAWFLNLLQRRLGLARERFTFIIVDCAPGLDIFTRAMYRFAGAVIVPVKPDYLSTSSASSGLDYIDGMQMTESGVTVQAILPTFYTERHLLDQDILGRLRESYGDLVSTPIPRSQLVAEAPAYGQTIFESDRLRQNQAATAYYHLVEKVYHG